MVLVTFSLEVNHLLNFWWADDTDWSILEVYAFFGPPETKQTGQVSQGICLIVLNVLKFCNIVQESDDTWYLTLSQIFRVMAKVSGTFLVLVLLINFVIICIFMYMLLFRSCLGEPRLDPALENQSSSSELRYRIGRKRRHRPLSESEQRGVRLR